MTQQAVDDLQQGLLHAGKAFLQQLRNANGRITGLISPQLANSHGKFDPQPTYLSQVSHQVQGYLSEGIVEVATDHVDPVGAVAGIAVRAVEAHHVSQVGECGRLLICTHLGYFISRLLAERSGAVKVLDEVWQEAQDVQRKTCRQTYQDNRNTLSAMKR